MRRLGFIMLAAGLIVAAPPATAQPGDQPTVPAELPQAMESQRLRTLMDRFWAEAYYEAKSNTHGRDNVVMDLWFKEGMRLFDSPRAGRASLYVKQRLFADRIGEFWNNRAEAALGLRWQPWTDLGLVLFGEGIVGDYTGRENIDVNPDDSAYTDIQAGAYFWQYWGTQPWQIERPLLCLPCTGWRELYADAIYYDRDDGNVIATADYKEGLLLARLGPATLDAYLNVEAAVDEHGDYWNNYVRGGPGIRIAPFENFDLKLSVEYFVGDYWRGDPGDTADPFTDVVVLLAFWKGW